MKGLGTDQHTIAVWRKVVPLPEKYHGGAVVIGNFDGIHVGHRELIQRAVADGKRLNGEPLVFTFHPHPIEILAPERGFVYLTSFRDKIALLEQAGAEGVLSIPFDREFSQRSAENFLEEVLWRCVRPKKVIVGWNFRYGSKRSGDVELLKTFGKSKGFEVEVVDAIAAEGDTVSSSRIRTIIAAEGGIDEATALLGRAYSIRGEVRHGAKIGRRIGFPTLNLAPERMATPAAGIYAALVELDGALHPSACYIGSRPTFDGQGVLIESHLLDWQGDAYGKMHRVHFLHKTRDDRKFGSGEELAEQIKRDVETVRAYFAERTPPPLWPRPA